MKRENPYGILEFTNPSGKIVFQIYARIDGKRFRKNFPTRAEAEAERQILGIQYLQETEMRVAATRLADAPHSLGRSHRRNPSLDRGNSAGCPPQHLPSRARVGESRRHGSALIAAPNSRDDRPPTAFNPRPLDRAGIRQGSEQLIRLKRCIFVGAP